MTSKRKYFRLVGCAALMLMAAGCSGINASKTVTPLDFLLPGLGLPGLLKAEPQPQNPVAPQTNSVAVVAQVR